jgi:hypothetical protein
MNTKSADERRAETLIAQLSRIQTAHGPIPAAFVHDENGPPLDRCLPAKPFSFSTVANSELIFLWPTFGTDGESIGLKLFDGVCQGLEALAGDRLEVLPDSLARWVNGRDARDRWLMLVFGLSAEGITHRIQRRVRKCWADDGTTIPVGSLETAKQMLPNGFNGPLPENENSWFLEIDDVLQTSIHAVEYLSELPLPETPEGTKKTRSKQGKTASGAPAERKAQPTIEQVEKKTPELDIESIEWVASRKENLEKLGYPTTTLSDYRQATMGGRQLSAYFGIDKDGRRWRRQRNKTEGSTVFYYAPDLKKYRRKVSKR